MQEEIKIKGESTRTIVKYFTNFSGRTGGEDKTYFVVTDINDQPLKLTDSEFDTRFSLNSENYYVELSATTVSYKIYSGTVVETEFKQGLTQDEKDSIAARFTQKINLQANPTNQSNSVNNPFSCVFFEEYPFTDYFMNVKINQSMNSLDTLNVYNVALGETPKFTNDTGVLVGKLEAVQVLSDENGEKIRIPLKNTVVGIFNPSEAFPNIASTDEDGNRIRLNLYETLPQIDNPFDLKGYSSFQAYLTDVSYSTKDNSNPSIPEQYRYTTITNDRGEFILHNVPTGQQTLMIEVDLLKFGLEPEEVALNFFPYPTQEEPNVSEIPHFFFGQYPINIVPSWGDFQTGYTEMTLSVSLDLRKWCTYQIFPISAKYGLNSTQPYVLEELISQGYTNTQTVLIRDMTKALKIFDRPKVEIVKIPDIYDRNTDLRSAWNNEFKTKNNKVEFDVTAFNAFKLPANLYDPNGTNSRGEKGVWLNAYTFKVYFPDETVSFNASGMVGTWSSDGKEIFANHFDLSFTADAWWSRIPAGERFAPSAIGTWPYEKTWSLTYPDAYKVTKRPVVKNPYKEWDQNNNHKTNVDGFNVIPQLEPRYLDGDLIGGDDAWATNANGFGLQDYQPSIFGNMFAREVSKNETWRYEAIDWWADDFANGFNPGCTPGSYKYSKVPGCPPAGRPDISADVAERFMRLEAGYNYWLMPRGWPRIDVRNGWGDLLLVNDIKNIGNSVYPGYYPKRDGVYQYIDDVTIIVGQKSPWWSRFGRITAYRVEKPYYTLSKRPPPVEKFVKLHFGPLYFGGNSPNGGKNRDRTLVNMIYSCGSTGAFNRIYGIKIKIKNMGSIKIFFQGKEVFPQEEIEVTIASADGFDDAAQLTLPANADYNAFTNSYERADYEFYIFQGYSGNFPACNPYSSGTGELVSVWLPGWDQYGGSRLRLKYYKENRFGLPAFLEDESECNYWLTSIPAFVVDQAVVLIPNTFNAFYPYVTSQEDLNRKGSENYQIWRLQGMYWMPNFNGNQGWGFIDPAPRWTRTHPSQYLLSRFTDNVGNITFFGGKPLSFRFNTNGGDLNFSNIE